MKAEDLMVGDLLTFDECVHDKDFPIMRVDGILPDTLFVQINDSEGDDEVGYDDIVGIPLTPEILEKNGWALWEIEGEYRQKDAFAVYGRKAPFAVFDGIEINYVHELQHALRLCGIDIEIKL